MAADVKLLLRLYALYARMDLRWFLQDFKNCVICILSDLLISISSVSGVFLLAMRFQGVGSMSADEVLFMLGFFTLSDGALFLLFGGGNVHQISRRVGRGQVDHMLMQPVPLPMQLLAEGFLPVSGGSGLIIGLVIVAYATSKLNLIVTPGWLAALILLVLARVGIDMGLSFLMASSAFYQPVACEEISSVGHDLLQTLGRYPLSGLPQALVGVLLTALPAGLMAWFPSLILLGKTPMNPSVWLPVCVAAALISLATTFFRKGLRHYEKTGSQRYRDMGHRN